jgi:hypothetical protein
VTGWTAAGVGTGVALVGGGGGGAGFDRVFVVDDEVGSADCRGSGAQQFSTAALMMVSTTTMAIRR